MTRQKDNFCTDDADSVVIDIRTSTDSRKTSFLSKMNHKRVYSLNKTDNPILTKIIEEVLCDVQEKTDKKLTLPTTNRSYTITCGSITDSDGSVPTYIKPLTLTRKRAICSDNFTIRRPTTDYTTESNKTVSRLLTTQLFGSPEVSNLSIYPTPTENRLTVVTDELTEAMQKLTTLLDEVTNTATTTRINTDTPSNNGEMRLQSSTDSQFEQHRKKFLQTTTDISRLQWVIESLTTSYVPVDRIVDAANTEREYAERFLSLMSEIGILSRKATSSTISYKLSNEYIAWKQESDKSPPTTKEEFISSKHTPEELLNLSYKTSTA